MQKLKILAALFILALALGSGFGAASAQTH